METITGFFLGLTGSFHCIFMCGPIALSLPAGSGNKLSFISGRLLYNTGRTFTYVMMGAVFGLLGNRIYLAGLQQSVSVITGFIIILSLIISFRGVRLINYFPFSIKTIINFRKLFISVYKRKSKKALFLTGVLNGFLPCGFVYIALSGAILTGEVSSAIVYMGLFGMGTFPLMLSLSLSGNFISTGFKQKINRLLPLFILVFSLILILRGLNLGIKFISPNLDQPKVHEENMICP